jgi:hypothetical protein
MARQWPITKSFDSQLIEVFVYTEKALAILGRPRGRPMLRAAGLDLKTEIHPLFHDFHEGDEIFALQ